jgi:cytochrome c
VNAVAFLPGGRMATGGADGRIALWRPGSLLPDRVLEGHAGPVSALAVAPDGSALASAAWDRTVRVWPLRGGAPRVLEGHTDNVNGVAFSFDGQSLVSVGYDATLRFWRRTGEGAPGVVRAPTALNAIVVAPDGEVIVAGADGRLRFLEGDGLLRGEMEVAASPVTTLAISADGRTLAAAGVKGAVAVVDRVQRQLRGSLVGPGQPVWALAFAPDGKLLLTGGSDGVVRRWDVATLKPLDDVAATAAAANAPTSHGARVFRACAACHALEANGGERAGPTLHGLFGRRIASVPGYDYSDALRELEIVWTPATVAELFRQGPARYTPGTRMPEQVIGDPADLAALIDYLEAATAK